MRACEIPNLLSVRSSVMVVIHIPMEGLEGPVSLSEKAKKNRRRITRKKTDSTQPVPTPDNDDEDMIEAHSSHDAEQTLSEGKDGTNDDADELMIDANIASLSQNMSAAPVFAPADPSVEKTTMKSETRRVPIPPHRMTPLKKDWSNIFGPLTEILGLQVRMNMQRRCVEIRVFGLLSVQPEAKSDVKFKTSRETKDIGALQKGADFIKAYALGFDVNVRAASESHRR